MTTTNPINVYIEGDKTGFNSKTAIERFRSNVKSNTAFDINELANKYIKPDYKLELVEQTDMNIKFNITMTKTVTTDAPVASDVPDDATKRKQLLKAKINMMRKDRTNSDYHKAKSNNNVPDEILAEYLKLKKVSKMPIPEPSEILSNPEEYKPIISMVLSNSMMKQFGASHPYVRYFKLIAEKLGVETPLPIPTQDYLSNPIDTNQDTDEED